VFVFVESDALFDVVLPTAQQGAVTPVEHSDWRAAAETVMEGSEDWQMGNAGVEDGPWPGSSGGGNGGKGSSDGGVSGRY